MVINSTIKPQTSAGLCFSSLNHTDRGSHWRGWSVGKKSRHLGVIYMGGSPTLDIFMDTSQLLTQLLYLLTEWVKSPRGHMWAPEMRLWAQQQVNIAVNLNASHSTLPALGKTCTTLSPGVPWGQASDLLHHESLPGQPFHLSPPAAPENYLLSHPAPLSYFFLVVFLQLQIISPTTLSLSHFLLVQTVPQPLVLIPINQSPVHIQTPSVMTRSHRRIWI